MSEERLVWLPILFMFTFGVSLSIWPARVVQSLARYAPKGPWSQVVSDLVATDGYIGMCRVIGILLLFMASFGLLSLLLLN